MGVEALGQINKIIMITLKNGGSPCTQQLETFPVRIPIDVDLSKCHNSYNAKHKKRAEDQNAYFLSMLVHKCEQRRLPMNSFHTIPRLTIQTIFSQNYKNNIDKLIELEYIKQYSKPYVCMIDGLLKECKGTYSVANGKAKRYGLNYKEPILKTYVITDKIIITKIKKARTEKTKRTIENDATAKKVYENIKLLSINENAAVKFLNDKYNKKTIDGYFNYLDGRIGADETNVFIQKVQRKKINKKNLQKVFRSYGFPVKHCKEVKNIFHSYNSLQYRLHQVEIIKRIQDGEHHLISMAKDYKTGRLFHTMTMTPKDIRPFLSLGNEAPIELDASNCQWWFLQKVVHILISKRFFSFFNNKKVNTHTPYNIDNYIQAPAYLYMCTTFINKHRSIIQKELHTLESLLYKDEFRNKFTELFKDSEVDVTDGDVKGWLLKHILFSNPETPYHKNLKVVKEFNKLFPYISNIIRRLKLDVLDERELQPKEDKNGKPVRWKCLAILLQKMEADVFVKGMANVDAPFITLHDAIITNDTNLHIIQNALSSELKRNSLKMKLKLNKYEI